jgi:hypothetical protein
MGIHDRISSVLTRLEREEIMKRAECSIAKLRAILEMMTSRKQNCIQPSIQNHVYTSSPLCLYMLGWGPRPLANPSSHPLQQGPAGSPSTHVSHTQRNNTQPNSLLNCLTTTNRQKTMMSGHLGISPIRSFLFFSFLSCFKFPGTRLWFIPNGQPPPPPPFSAVYTHTLYVRLYVPPFSYI